MRILFISFQFPYPPHSGSKQRILNFIKTLSCLKDVEQLDFLSFYNKESKIEDYYIQTLKRYCNKVVLVDNSDIHLRKYYNIIYHNSFFIRLFYHLSSLKPTIIRFSYSQCFIQAFKSLHPNSYDIIWVERIFIADMLKKFRKKIVLDLDDIEHLKKTRELKYTKFYPSLLLEYLDVFKLKFYEKNVYKYFSKVLVCSQQDKQYLGNHDNIFILPNVVNLPSLDDNSQEEENVIVFIGIMSYYPNTDAMVYFCNDIFPHIKKLNNKVKLYIVGGNPPKDILKLHNDYDIFVTGYVPEVTPYIKKASVVVVPIRIGGGTRIKILEALAHKKAVISTSIGAEGIEVEDGKHILIEDNPIKFAEKVSELLKDKQKRKFLGENGRRLIKEKYSQEGLVKKISSIIR